MLFRSIKRIAKKFADKSLQGFKIDPKVDETTFNFSSLSKEINNKMKGYQKSIPAETFSDNSGEKLFNYVKNNKLPLTSDELNTVKKNIQNQFIIKYTVQLN